MTSSDQLPIQQICVEGHTFSMAEAKYDFSSACLLGLGSYGVVARAQEKRNNKKEVAIKRVRPYDYSCRFARGILTEIRVMKVLKYHPNVSCESQVSLIIFAD